MPDTATTTTARRVALVVSLDDDRRTYFLGYGTLGPSEVPPEGVGMLCDALRSAGERTPVITLEHTGEVVYGCECYWDDAELVDEMTAETELFPLTLTELREATHYADQDTTVR
jgi:hypothetical protein